MDTALRFGGPILVRQALERTNTGISEERSSRLSRCPSCENKVLFSKAERRGLQRQIQQPKEGLKSTRSVTEGKRRVSLQGKQRRRELSSMTGMPGDARKYGRHG